MDTKIDLASLSEEDKKSLAKALVGSIGGAQKTAKKAAASRENGKKGGRPAQYHIYYQACGCPEGSETKPSKDDVTSWLDQDVIDIFVNSLPTPPDYVKVSVKYGDSIVFKGIARADEDKCWWEVEINELGDFFANTEEKKD